MGDLCVRSPSPDQSGYPAPAGAVAGARPAPDRTDELFAAVESEEVHECSHNFTVISGMKRASKAEAEKAGCSL